MKSLQISLNRIQNFLVIKDIDLHIYNEFKKNMEENISENIAINYENCDFGIKTEEYGKKMIKFY